MSKYNIGDKVPREGKTSLVIFECTNDGKYMARTMRQSMRIHNIPCPPEEIQPGKILNLPNGKEIVIVGEKAEAGRWDTAHNDCVVLHEGEIDLALAEEHARKIYGSVATRRETGGNSRNLRYLPRRLEANQED